MDKFIFYVNNFCSSKCVANMLNGIDVSVVVFPLTIQFVTVFVIVFVFYLPLDCPTATLNHPDGGGSPQLMLMKHFI